MKKHKTFRSFWVEYATKSVHARKAYFKTLSTKEQSDLIADLFDDGWQDLLVHNIIDQRLDFIKKAYGIDLIDLRIKALKFGKVFLVQRKIWNQIETLICEFDQFYNCDLVFGGLLVTDWDKNKLMCRIRAA